jgi:glycosyltransferase involved in cell wall biosynthesis
LTTPGKILFLNHTAKVSGAERVLLVILRNLDRTHFLPCVGCPAGPLADACAEIDVPVVPLPEIHARFTSNPLQLLRSIGSALGSVSAFRRSLRDVRPDIVHANTVRAGLIAALASLGLGIPVVWHLHDMLPRSRFGNLIRLFAYRLRAVSAIAVSRASEASFRIPSAERRIRNFPITVIHNSVDTVRYHPDSRARTRIREELALTPDDVAVGIVAQLTRRKKQLELIRAFADHAAAMPRVHLILVGSPLFTADDRAFAAEIHALVAAAGTLGRQVHLLGERRDIPELLAAMDIVALNSAAEPFGLALAEGLATEVPAAAPARDGFLEVVDHNVTGLLSPPDDVGALIANIGRLAADPAMRARMGLAGRAQMVERFSEARQVAAMHSFYLRLAGRRIAEQPA